MIDSIMRNPFLHLRDLEDLTLDRGIHDFLPPWQKDSALHKFVRFVADDLLMSDSDGPTRVRFDSDARHPEWILPVDAAMINYGITSEPSFLIPEDPTPKVTARSTLPPQHEDPHFVENACYEHLLELRVSQAYGELLARIADEVFFVMFMNRRALANLNKFLATHVDDIDPSFLEGEDRELAALFVDEGELKRSRPPTWARRAVFYRDRGRCTNCAADLSGLVDSFPAANYDHMIPLARGGLNDVTNIQLLCERCNLRKSDKITHPSNQYRRWY
ncbi:HNH endonuclease [Streptomyces fradiae]|uniref:HNH endonuclease n=1 Tax=Streptomyces fradiae TaxID=1906 RepID=UPI0035BE573D